VFICNVDPLDVLPGACFLILEFVLNVRSPSDIFLVDRNLCASSFVNQFKRVGEDTLSDETTRNGCCLRDKGYRRSSNIVYDIHVSKVCVGGDRVALAEVSDFDGLSHELLVVLRLDIASVILVEVVKLIIDKDGTSHLVGDFDSLLAFVS